MLVFWDARLVFLATPKAGSTAVQVALESLASMSVDRPAILKHTSASDFQRHVAPWLEDRAGAKFTTVALMREPLSWLQSWYRFHLQETRDQTDDQPEGENFEAFINRYCREVDEGTSLIGTQAGFLGHGSERPVNRIFRYEEIDQFTHFLEDALDCVINLPRINVPRSADVSISVDTREALQAVLANDIALYRSL